MFAMILSFCSFRARARVPQIWGPCGPFQARLRCLREAARLGADDSKNPWVGLPLDGGAASQPVRALRGRVRMWSSRRPRALLVRGIPRPVRTDPRSGLLLSPLSQRVDPNRSEVDETAEPLGTADSGELSD